MTNPMIFYGKPLIFRPGSHRYYWGGEPVPSVTTILGRLAKPALIQWAADMAVQHIQMRALDLQTGTIVLSALCEEARKAHAVKRDAAGDVGTIVHEYAAGQLRKDDKVIPLPPDPQVLKAADALKAWLSEHEVVPLAIERRVLSKHYLYAGTTDFFGHVDGKLSVLDFKTGSGIYDEFWLQTAGYEIALREELGLTEPIVRWLIHLDKKTGQCVPHSRPDISIDGPAWLALVELDRHLRAMRKAA